MSNQLNRDLITPQEVSPGQDLQDTLQCPVCYEICVPPIYICVEGHSLCQCCKKKVGKKCPYCRKAINNGRNYALESIYNILQFSCKYKENGCGESPRGEHFQTHVNSCPFRPYDCKFLGCRKSGGSSINVNDYLPHLKESHGTVLKSSGEYCLHSQTIPNTQSSAFSTRLTLDVPLAVWKFDGKHFLERLVLDREFICIMLLFVGDKSEAVKYKADFHLIKEGPDCAPNIMIMVNQIDVHSIRDFPDPSITEDGMMPITENWYFVATYFQTSICQQDPETNQSRWLSRVDIRKIVT